jgi:putative DNA primase/helicase
VAPFDMAFLPATIAPWAGDIVERMQCAPEFVGAPIFVTLGSVIGRKIGIRPQKHTDWTEVPNLWCCLVGRPGQLKTPAMGEAVKPLARLEALACDEHEGAVKRHARELDLFKLKAEEGRQAARKAIRRGDQATLSELDEPESPRERRYIANDTSYEKLGELLADNPNGLLAFRDELVSLFKTLDREEYAAARGFFLTSWDGKSGYVFDRITRGKTRIEAACVSLLGSTQPGPLAEYVRRACKGAGGDDGLIQRISLLVWPDLSGWRDCDRFPNSEARDQAWQTFERLNSLNPDAVQAERDQFSSLPFLRFDGQAQRLFSEWRADLEKRLRANDIAPALESHFAKYRKLIPALALINHLADNGVGPISEKALLRSLAFVDYLETHARRAYGSGPAAEAATAQLILDRIRKGDLKDEFAARDIYRSGWSGLTDADMVKAGLELLVDLDWLALKTSDTGGRPRTAFMINPRTFR